MKKLLNSIYGPRFILILLVVISLTQSGYTQKDKLSINERIKYGKTIVGDSNRAIKSAMLFFRADSFASVLERKYTPKVKPNFYRPISNFLRRHKGPFYRNPDFEKIQILLGNGQWYYNDYFSSI